MSVISFEKYKAKNSPHWSGTAYCVGCKHEWEAAAPTGTINIECPVCGLPKGVPKYPFGADIGDAVLTCTDCGCIAITAYKHASRFYVQCMGCGCDLTESFYEG